MSPDPAIYRRAADVLRAAGWTQDYFMDDCGRHCTVGALRAARAIQGRFGTGDDEMAEPLVDLLGIARKRLPATDLIHWNDADGRTAEDVITLLEQAAEKLEADQ